MSLWRHNALLGSCGMAKSLCIQVQECRTTSPRAKELAERIGTLVGLLNDELRLVRMDPETGAAWPYKRAPDGIDGGAAPMVQRDNTKDTTA